MPVIGKKIPADSIGYLLLGWFLVLPFGSQLAAVSIGFMTLYPSLIIAGVLFLVTIGSFAKWQRWEKGIFLFLTAWLIQGAVMAAVNRSLHESAIFDIRSLGMQVLFAGAIFGAKEKLGIQAFLNILVKGVCLFTFILFVSGILEWSTTIHFAGKTTAKLTELSGSNTVMRAPLFLYDNANDFLLHLIFFYSWTLILSQRIRSSRWLVVLGWLLIYLFAVYAQSRFAGLIALAGLLVTLGYQAASFLKARGREKMLPYVIVSALFGIVIATNPLFIGPDHAHGADYRLNDFQIVENRSGAYVTKPVKEVLSEQEQAKLIHDIDSAIAASPEGSVNLRKNLILNGLSFVRSSPLTGIGPGNYTYRLLHSKDLLYTGTVTNPHCFPIEIISQYGLMGVAYFIIIVLLFIKLFRLGRLRIREPNWLLFLFLILPVLWNIPSAFLYLDIHRLLLPLLIVLLVHDPLAVRTEEGGKHE